MNTSLEQFVHSSGYILLATLGILLGVGWAWNILVFLAWVLVILSLMVFLVVEETQESIRAGKSTFKPIAPWVRMYDFICDTLIILMLAGTAHFFVAGLWFLQAVLGNTVYVLLNEVKETADEH